ncbi:sensor domain-containing protein [Caldimonas aquatica]|uniref:EAL domain-containing protein n=1 Tax=Caldimonas aquatica TaxID=376175 RepID=A0ABY6MT28_9BURK|nr:EAL domain-containing protein [Schlegelella aquatica]UZD55172.1 EAL domain-containing protein [Schlegelella aquatica]
MSVADPYRLVFEHSPLGLALVCEGRFHLVNERFERLLGWPAGTLEGQSWGCVWPPGAEPPGEADEGVELECELQRSDGTRFWARLRAAPASGPAAGPGALVLIVEDASAHRGMIDRLHRVQRDLEARVQERTEALARAHAQLRQEMVDRQVAESRVRHLAEHDALTGLPNRRLLELRLREALRDAGEQRELVAVLLMDLERFKTINDSLGHLVGDRLLQAIAHRLRSSVRPGDTVARLAGDEFAMVLPGLQTSAEAARLAAELIEELSRPYAVDDMELRVTPSVGISLYPDHGDGPETLLGKAAAAMYQAKANGRTHYHVFSGHAADSSTERLLLENDLHRALERGEFVLHYQPRYELATGMLCACEALLRWEHPTRGDIDPGEFVPLAEESGLVVRIGDWVLREACRQIQRWQSRGREVCPISVNISARQFRSLDLMSMIRGALDETGVDPHLLELEITETTLMRNTEETLSILGQLHALGIKISVDDFGTGYSSLAYLKRFPVDLLKIDRSFVHDLATDADSAVIVSAIIGLARSLQLRVVAEGVETPEQVDFLKRRGCDEVQGFLFSKPLPAAQIEPLFNLRY